MPGWAAGRVRATAMAQRAIGPGAARRLAGCGSLPDAQRMLATTSYAPAARPGEDLAATQRAVAGLVLWDLRVLAGWLPRAGVGLLRLLAGWFELANVDELLQSLQGRQAEREYHLGALATAWPRLRDAGSAAGLRAALAASPWGDPGSATPAGIRLGMRARWAARVAAAGDPARDWAAGAAALLLAGELFGPADPGDTAGPGGAGGPGGPGDTAGRPGTETSAGRASAGQGGTGQAGGSAGHGATPGWAGAGGAAGRAGAGSTALGGLSALLGPAARGAASLGALRDALPARARWALDRAVVPEDLWLAEAAWWARVARDGHALLHAASPDSAPVLGAAAVLAADAWRACAALELAARGGGEPEERDALA